MPTEQEGERLAAAYARYERALAQEDPGERAAARLTLCRLLAATGWAVPEDVRDQMRRDERALRLLAEQAGTTLPDLLRAPSHRSPWVEGD